MNSLLLILLVISLCALAWVSWQHWKLLTGLGKYVNSVENADTDVIPHHKHLENLTASISSLRKSLETRLDNVIAENVRLANILNQMTDGVLIVDSSGYIQFANPAVDNLCDVENIIGRTVAEVIRHHQLIDTWKRGQQNKVVQSETVEMPATRRFLQMVVLPDEQNGTMLLIQDLTRLRRLELVRQDFISNVSHELRTPLASLKALTETLQAGALEDDLPAARRFIQRIEAEVDALTQMTSELLDLTRIESRQTVLHLTPISPVHILGSVAERMKMQAERASLEIMVQAENDLPVIQADPGRVEQVLVNIIHNAIKFTQPGGKITLGATKMEQKNGIPGKSKPVIQFFVRDTGIGIPEDELPRIFERFYRVDRARTRGSGTGLGLSIAKHIIDGHTGKIWAESEEGKGSTFSFTLPVCNSINHQP